MTRRVRRRPAARRDLLAIYQRYARDAGLRVADRFLNDAEAAFRQLAVTPGIGTRYGFVHPDIADVRVSPLARPFKVFLIFYRPGTDGVEILRVLHSARDLQRILSEEFGVETDDEGG